MQSGVQIQRLTHIHVTVVFRFRGIDAHVLHGKAGVQDLDTSNFPLTVCTYFSPLFSDFRQLTPVLTYYFYRITPPKKS